MGRGTYWALMGVVFFATTCQAGANRRKPITCERMFWSQALIAQALKGLHERNINLGSRALSLDGSAQTMQALKEILGKGTSGKALYAASGKYFETYPRALEAAGIDFNSVSTRSKFDKPTILRAIQALYKEGVNLQPRFIAGDLTRSTRDLIKKHTGLSATGALLFRRALRFYGTFRFALEAAGIDPTSQNVHFNRTVSTVYFLSDYIEDDRVRLMTKRTGPYEELRFDETMEILFGCARALPGYQQEQAFNFLEQGVKNGEQDPHWSEFFKNCLEEKLFEY